MSWTPLKILYVEMWKAQKTNHTYECTKGQASD